MMYMLLTKLLEIQQFSIMMLKDLMIMFWTLLKLWDFLKVQLKKYKKNNKILKNKFVKHNKYLFL